MNDKIIYQTNTLLHLRHSYSLNLQLPEFLQTKFYSTQFNSNYTNNFYITQNEIYPISAYVVIHRSNLTQSPPIVSNSKFSLGSTAPSSSNFNQASSISSSNHPITIPVLQIKQDSEIPPGGLPLESILNNHQLTNNFSPPICQQTTVVAQNENCNANAINNNDEEINVIATSNSKTINSTTTTTTSSDVIIQILPD